MPVTDYCASKGMPVDVITKPHLLPLLDVNSERIAVHEYVQAHAFIAQLENARVFGNGFILMDDALLAHGLTSGNYLDNIGWQLKEYDSGENFYKIPDGGEIDGEYVLLWGNSNFGHWLFTYLMRLTLLWYRPEFKRFPLLVPDTLPKRFLEWTAAMGLRYVRRGGDGVLVKKLIVPSVVTYRGGYEDQRPFLFPQGVEIMRHVILKDLALPRYPRERIYISRAKCAYRNMANEDALVAMLSNHGIRRVFMEELSFQQQLDLISRADLIVTHIGGGSPITMFAPRDCHIIEITTENFWGAFTSRAWAHILGQHFTRVIGKELPKNGGELKIDHDCEVDINELEALL